MSVIDRPTDVIWDITYACPLRCVHCYSESGRRPARQLGDADLRRVTDAIVALRPDAVALAGGEPLLVKGVFEVAERIVEAGIAVILYTSGWNVTPAVAGDLARLCTRVAVSVDGATAEVNDRLRGRAGGYDRAVRALHLLDDAAATRPLQFGIDCVVTRSNFHQLETFCSEIAPRFPRLGFLSFGAVVPTGLASRVTFAEHEILTDDQVRELANPQTAKRLQYLSPPTVQVGVTDNRALRVHPDDIAAGFELPVMQVEPDGAVRAMPIYEGTVGDLRTDDPHEVWRRCLERRRDPFVVATLAPVRTMADWAAATRRIDLHFGTPEVRTRIERRPAYVPTR